MTCAFPYESVYVCQSVGEACERCKLPWLFQKTCVAQSVGNPGICMPNWMQILALLILAGVLTIIVAYVNSKSIKKEQSSGELAK